jgi:hypothetical protein
MQADAILAEKAVDCLRILTTGNERNQLALYNIPVAIRALVRIMTISSPTSVRPQADKYRKSSQAFNAAAPFVPVDK